MTVLIVDKGVDLDSKPSCNSVQIIITEKSRLPYSISRDFLKVYQLLAIDIALKRKS